MKIIQILGMGALGALVSCGAPTPPSKEPKSEPATAAEDHSKHGKTFAAGPTYADSVNEGIIPKDTMKTSVRRVTMSDIGDCHVHIEYGSPGVRGRSIWGGLVAYREVWAAGAHSATSIRFSKPVEVAGKKIDAGTYGFFAIPDQDTWQLILNTRYKQHLADDYRQEEDVVRLSVVPEKINTVQRLTYGVETSSKNSATQSAGFVTLSWDTIQVKLPFLVLP